MGVDKTIPRGGGGQCDKTDASTHSSERTRFKHTQLSFNVAGVRNVGGLGRCYRAMLGSHVGSFFFFFVCFGRGGDLLVTTPFSTHKSASICADCISCDTFGSPSLV